ncbi:MAG: FkbM family methyltransferase [Rhodobacteraceae bacterium]|nr:FkbM family methyltransferase [Paracoccaceae bacterium]
MAPEEKIKSAIRLLNEAFHELQAAAKSERTRRRAPITRDIHRVARMLEDPPCYYSQAGQDRVVDRLLLGKQGGVYADIGGYNGVTGSNTLFFEIFRGWSGILVEPAPAQLRQAEAVRRCPCYGYAVAGEACTLEFMEVTAGFTQMSGFLDTYDANLLAQVRGDPRHREKIHTLEAKPLGSILAQGGLNRIDYLSLDVEGGEMDILRSFDFDAFDVQIWSIENNTANSALPELMKEQGYDLVEFAGVDDIFRKRES